MCKRAVPLKPSQTQSNVARRHLHRCSICLHLPPPSDKGTTGPALKCSSLHTHSPMDREEPSGLRSLVENTGVSTKKVLKLLMSRPLLGLSYGSSFAKQSEVVEQQRFCLFAWNISWCLFRGFVMPRFVTFLKCKRFPLNYNACGFA